MNVLIIHCSVTIYGFILRAFMRVYESIPGLLVNKIASSCNGAVSCSLLWRLESCHGFTHCNQFIKAPSVQFRRSALSNSWTAACQASWSTTNSRSLLKLMSIKSVMPYSVVPFPSCLQSFPASGSFLRSQFFTSDGQSIGASASAPVLPMNIQGWFPLGLTGWISL